MRAPLTGLLDQWAEISDCVFSPLAQADRTEAPGPGRPLQPIPCTYVEPDRKKPPGDHPAEL